MGRCVYDTIEDLQEDIGHPCAPELAVDLYSALLGVGVEPDYETWCEVERGVCEQPAIAELRLRIQREVLVDDSPMGQATTDHDHSRRDGS
jgi:hypothetical protein